MTHDYVRNGTTSLFAAYDLASGSVIAQPYRRAGTATRSSCASSSSSTPPDQLPQAWLRLGPNPP
jgi:hypothetical protein